MQKIRAFLSSLRRFLSDVPETCCEQEIVPFGHGDPRVVKAARKELRKMKEEKRSI